MFVAREVVVLDFFDTCKLYNKSEQCRTIVHITLHTIKCTLSRTLLQFAILLKRIVRMWYTIRCLRNKCVRLDVCTTKLFLDMYM